MVIMSVRDYLNRKLDDWNWLKDIEDDTCIYNELVDMPVRPNFNHRPYMCQLVSYWIGICQPRFIFLLPMSSGKTKLILDLFSYRLRERDGNLKGLILVPREPNIQTWLDENEEHTPDTRVIAITGSSDQKRQLLMMDADLYIARYSDLQFIMAELVPVKNSKKKKRQPVDRLCKAVTKRIDFLACDEIHKAGNHESLIYKLIKRISKEADYAYGITGTPFSRKVERLWAIFRLIDLGETFGTTLTGFREVFFTKVKNPWSKWSKNEFDDSMTEELHRIMQHRSIRYEDHEVKELPPIVYRREELSLESKQLQLYRDAMKGLVDEGYGEFSKKELEAKYVRARMALAGYVEWKDENYKKKGVYLPTDAKLEWLQDFTEDTEEKVVIFYQYTSTGKRITQMLKKQKKNYKWLYSGTKDKIGTYKAFRTNPDIQYLVINSASGDAGLQFEMARYAIFYESPEDPVTREQAEKRAARDGKNATSNTFIIDLVPKRSLDGRILRSIEEGMDFQQQVLSGRIDDWDY